MHQPGTSRGRPGPRTSASGQYRLPIFSVLFFLLLPLVLGSNQPSKVSAQAGAQGPGEVLVVRGERWRLCGKTALDPEDSQWSCCRDLYPFHRPTQRCCYTFDAGAFLVIPKDCKKEEAEDCKTYTQGTLGGVCSSQRPGRDLTEAAKADPGNLWV